MNFEGAIHDTCAWHANACVGITKNVWGFSPEAPPPPPLSLHMVYIAGCTSCHKCFCVSKYPPNACDISSYAMYANNSRQILEKKSRKCYSIGASEFYIYRQFSIVEMH